MAVPKMHTDHTGTHRLILCILLLDLEIKCEEVSCGTVTNSSERDGWIPPSEDLCHSLDVLRNPV